MLAAILSECVSCDRKVKQKEKVADPSRRRTRKLTRFSSDQYNIFSTIGRIAIVVLVIFSYPLQCHPCRASLNHVLHWFSELPTKDNISIAESNDESVDENSRLVAEEESNDGHGPSLHVPLGTTKFITLTTIILILSFWLAVTVDSLELMLAFVGSTGSTSISFILPGIFGYSLIGNPKLPTRGTIAHPRFLRIASLVLTLWGILVVIVCLGTNIWLLTKTK